MKLRAFIFGVPVALLCLLSLVLLYRWEPPASVQVPPDAPAPSTPPPLLTIVEDNAKINVLKPQRDALATSPLVLHGEAKGTWYFEASFPIELRTGTDTVVASGSASALGEWMTEEFVPFTGTLSWSTTTATSGVLIFHKSNPSGLPEHDETFELPVAL